MLQVFIFACSLSNLNFTRSDFFLFLFPVTKDCISDNIHGFKLKLNVL